MNRTAVARYLPLLLCVVLASVTLATFWPVLQNEFINYDDPDYVTANAVVKKGMNWDGIHWAFTTGHASNWHPVTWLSHMLDVSVSGMKPMGHHLTNLLFHCMNAVLLLVWLWQMTGTLWRSFMVAALFALHPLHVESVAWVAERKDVLSTFFGLLTLMAYVRYVKTRGGTTPHLTLSPNEAERAGRAWYGVALVLFALGLMSKPMLVTWPFVMLLLDHWPLNRIRIEANVFSRNAWTLNQRLIREKLPFLALAIGSCIITLIVQSGAMAKPEVVPLGERLGNAILAYANYLKQTVWPTKLAVFYPFPESFPIGEFVVAIGILIAICWLAFRLARSYPFAMVGWLWFLGTLIPVIGLVQVGAQAHADRYTYLPLIGIFWAMSWGLWGVAQQREWTKRLIVAVALLSLIGLSITSRVQVRHWRDDRTLYTQAARVTTRNYIALSGLGIADAKAGDWPRAMTNLLQAYEYARSRRTERTISYYLGVALQMQGKPKEALPYLEDCIVSAELQPERDHRLGLSLLDAGRVAEAETAIKTALAAKPESLDYNLGMAALLVAKGELSEAERIYVEVVSKHSDEPVALKSYGDFLTLANRHIEAETRYAAAVKLKPSDAAYRKAYAASLRHNGRLELAKDHYEKAFDLVNPTLEELLNLAEIHAQLGQNQKVLNCYNRAVEQEPDSIAVLNNLAWLLATCPEDGIRNGTRAVELAERACELTNWNAAVLLGTLAAAYAEAGKFPEAVTTAEKAITQARAEKQDDVVKRNRELLELYHTGKPYREK